MSCLTLNANRMPSDWGRGFWPDGTQQTNIIKRLLMYGHGDYPPHKADILPYGNIHGVGYKLVNGQRVFSLDMWKVGLKDVERRIDRIRHL